MTGSHLLPP